MSKIFTTSKTLHPILAAVLVSVLFVVSACSTEEPEPPKPQPPVISIDNDTVYSDFTTPITVKSPNGKLKNVSMSNDEGVEIEGKFNSEHTEWTTAQKLGYSRTYTVTGSNADGETSKTFTTITPEAQMDGYLAPLDGSTVGVGQSIAVRFDYVVADKQAAQDAITVTTEPAVEGAFYWISGQEVRWRPEHFWEPGTQVHVVADLYGRDLGDNTYGADDREASFTIGDKVEAVADDNTKTMTISRNGEVEQTMPISMGLDNQYPTPNGIYVVGDQHDKLMMDSATFGLTGSGSYKTTVDYATQMSYSGIYIHGAPWSVGSQGYANTSHGCINVSTENALWVYQNMKRGDIVTVQNTVGPTLPGTDGLGDWNIPWDVWSAGNTNE